MRASNLCLFLAMVLTFATTTLGMGHRLRRPLLFLGCGVFVVGMLLWGLE